MDRFKTLQAFVLAANKGSLSAAAVVEGVSPAVMSRRLDALEARLGVKLMVRSTRRLVLTSEGEAFLEQCARIFDELDAAEAAVSLGGLQPAGHLRISAPAGFGRRHVAPVLGEFLAAHPQVEASLDLSDRMVDLVEEGIDCAIRIGESPDSSLISVRLGGMRRAVVGSPGYLAQHGRPVTPLELLAHNCLTLRQQRGWLFSDPAKPGESRLMKVGGRLVCNDGAVLREQALLGAGLCWRSEWEVGEDVHAGRLVTVLDEFAAPPMGIYALMPQRRLAPLRLRLWLDFVRERFASADYWAKAGVGRFTAPLPTGRAPVP
ncbi:LysR family transcriptional regulator [Niveibacterium sp. SC-1]|uniref:LysR family transcriptional regulator n=1 Tax=Niveibacterium sp. SC-1 TaxID=3135646 RepID=UPI00311F58DB